MSAALILPASPAALRTKLYKPINTFHHKASILNLKLLQNHPRQSRHLFNNPTIISCCSGDSFQLPQQNQDLSNVGLLYIFIILSSFYFTAIHSLVFVFTLYVKNQDQNGFWQKWKEKSSEMSRKLAKLGLAAVLGYGIFDAVTYTTFFVLAFLGYEKSTGNNPADNIQALLGIVILMWTGNNVTRPFRVAGAAALAPVIDKGLKRIQKHFNFATPAFAFGLVVGIVGGFSFTVAGLLILSRWGK